MPQMPSALLDQERGALAPAAGPPSDPRAGPARPAARTGPAAPPTGHGGSLSRSPPGKHPGRMARQQGAGGPFAGLSAAVTVAVAAFR